MQVNDPKLTLKKMYKQFKTICKHKKEVFDTCRIAGYPWVGLVHDLSKFHPTEFLESSAWQVDGKSPVTAAREAKGVSRAWLHHKGHNPHHWEYWTQSYRNDRAVAVKIPFRYITELFCDHVAAGIAYAKAGGPEWTPESAVAYWENLKPEACIHPESLALLDTWYYMLISHGKVETLKSLKSFEQMY